METGAYDGELMSNTLLLERVFGWTGLLIEPSRTLFPRLVQKHRRAWALKACCSQTGYPFQVRHRRAWALKACCSQTGYPFQVRHRRTWALKACCSQTGYPFQVRIQEYRTSFWMMFWRTLSPAAAVVIVYSLLLVCKVAQIELMD